MSGGYFNLRSEEMGDNVYPKFVKTILDLDEDYMRSKGIIED